jgi:ribosomal protein L21E
MLTFHRVGDIVDIKANGAVQKGSVLALGQSISTSKGSN